MILSSLFKRIFHINETRTYMTKLPEAPFSISIFSVDNGLYGGSSLDIFHEYAIVGSFFSVRFIKLLIRYTIVDTSPLVPQLTEMPH